MPPRDVLKTPIADRVRGRMVVTVGLVATLAAYVGWLISRPSPAKLLRTARQALSRGDLASAENFIEQALGRAPGSAEILVTAGEIAEKRGETARALDYYTRVPADGSVHAIVGAGAAGDAFLRLFRMSDAERSYRQILAVSRG